MSQQQFDDLRTRLLAAVAHEVRSLAAVAFTATGEIEPSLDEQPEQRRMLLIARRSLRRLLCVADRLSLAAELERQPLVLQRAPVHLRDLAVRVGGLACEAYGGGGVVFEVAPDEASEPTPPWVEADERWLGAALLELIGNALRHARARVRVRLSADDLRVTITVEDDGHGFPSSFVFADRERFSPDGVIGGMGLSLCMVGAVAAAHGGRFFGGASTLPPQRIGVLGASVSVELPRRVGSAAVDELLQLAELGVEPGLDRVPGDG